MMKHSTYTSYDELPLMLSVAEVAAVLGISRAGAYELVHGNGFPALKIGSRIVVPRDKFLAWIDANSGSKNAPLYCFISQFLVQRPLLFWFGCPPKPLSGRKAVYFLRFFVAFTAFFGGTPLRASARWFAS